MTDSDAVIEFPDGIVGTADKLYPRFYRRVQHLLKPDFFVLNIGANDGLYNDPIHPFLQMHPGWHGVLVEPVPYNFAQLKNNYKGFPDITLVNAAISKEHKAFYYVDEGANCDMRLVGQVCSFDKEYMEMSLRGLRMLAPDGTIADDAERHLVEDNSILCVTMKQLVEQYSIERVDFLNIDAEGRDFEIFEEFDFERFSPSIICVETVSFGEEERLAFDEIMKKHCYEPALKFESFTDVYIKA